MKVISIRLFQAKVQSHALSSRFLKVVLQSFYMHLVIFFISLPYYKTTLVYQVLKEPDEPESSRPRVVLTKDIWQRGMALR